MAGSTQELTMSPGPSIRNARLLMLGIVALPWFLFWSSVGGIVASRYSWVAQPARELTLIPGAPRAMLGVAAIGSGLSVIAFSIGLWRESRASFSWGALAWLWYGVTMISNGLWPMTNDLHGLYATGVTVYVAPGLALAESRWLQGQPAAYAVTGVVSVSAVLSLWLGMSGMSPEGYLGVMQRVIYVFRALWPAWVAWVVWREMRSRRPAR